MSDTPRTDAAIGKQMQDHPEWVDADLARQLERELNEANAYWNPREAQAEIKELERQRDEAVAERNALLKLITDHNADLARICGLQPCEAFRGRGRNCPSCPRDHAIELPEFAIFLADTARRLTKGT
jgi:hypothetical protein